VLAKSKLEQADILLSQRL